MSEKPILFSGPMVRAILEGRKTQTRRIARNLNIMRMEDMQCFLPDGDGNWIGWTSPDTPQLREFTIAAYPKGHGDGIKAPWRVGDLLWVRETFAVHSMAKDRISAPGEGHPWGSPIYRATFAGGLKPVCEGFSPWKPSIHMPRWASRITLGIKAVRVERLNDISEKDAMAEGCDPYMAGEGIIPPPIFPDTYQYRPDYKTGFAMLWDSINGTGAWDQNPWVWVIEFEVVK